MEPSFKFISDNVWIFDVECVPDVQSCRRYLYDYTSPDEKVIEMTYERQGIEQDSKTHILKPIFQKIISISVLCRKSIDGEVQLIFKELNEKELTEKEMIEKFLHGVGIQKRSNPAQLVGFASSIFDMPILTQRALVNGLTIPLFFERPDKPWEGVDYFAKGPWCIDLMYAIGYHQPTRPRLHEAASLCGIPGKLGIDGGDVFNLYKGGSLDEVIAYNQLDVLTTYLLWLRVVHLFGYISTEKYEEEQKLLRFKLEVESESNPYFGRFVETWDDLNNPENFKEIKNGKANKTRATKKAS